MNDSALLVCDGRELQPGGQLCRLPGRGDVDAGSRHGFARVARVFLDPRCAAMHAWQAPGLRALRLDYRRPFDDQVRADG